MAVVVMTVNEPGLEKRWPEVAYARRIVDETIKEFGRGNGTVTSGTIATYTTSLNSPTSAGSWTYTSSASKP
jgi:hypothetical protein